MYLIYEYFYVCMSQITGNLDKEFGYEKNIPNY